MSNFSGQVFKMIWVVRRAIIEVFWACVWRAAVIDSSLLPLFEAKKSNNALILVVFGPHSGAVQRMVKPAPGGVLQAFDGPGPKAMLVSGRVMGSDPHS